MHTRAAADLARSVAQPSPAGVRPAAEPARRARV